MSKSVGIITFHASYNYGSMLQAYALQSILRALGTEVSLINFRSQAQKNIYSLHPQGVGFQKKGKALAKLLFFPSVRRKNARFEDFLCSRFHLTPAYATPGALAASCPEFDVYLSGSDQIWNTDASDFSEAYLLTFAGAHRKVAYAASFGPIGRFRNAEWKAMMRKALADYHAISVREEKSAALVRELTGREVPVVVDPVLLLSQAQWGKILPAAPKKAERKYILFYTLYYEKDLEQTVRMISQKLGLPVVITKYVSYKEVLSPYRKEADCGPCEFLRLLQNAELVISASFHGTAFSILFNRPFFAYRGA